MAYTYKYPRPAVTADCVVITKERLRVGAKAGMAKPKVLLIERSGEPFKGCWALPGGFMNMDETTERCSFRATSAYCRNSVVPSLRQPSPPPHSPRQLSPLLDMMLGR